eukprot:1660864-Amphidinium_carterae.1
MGSSSLHRPLDFQLSSASMVDKWLSCCNCMLCNCRWPATPSDECLSTLQRTTPSHTFRADLLCTESAPATKEITCCCRRALVVGDCGWLSLVYVCLAPVGDKLGYLYCGKRFPHLTEKVLDPQDPNCWLECTRRALVANLLRS